MHGQNTAFYKEKFHYLLNIYISRGILNNKVISIGRGQMKNVFSDVNAEEVTPECLNGVYCELANLIGTEATFKIYETYRGQQITFPVYMFNKDFIAKKIMEEYNGRNVKLLASKFGYSEKWIRKIIKDNKQEENNGAD